VISPTRAAASSREDEASGRTITNSPGHHNRSDVAGQRRERRSSAAKHRELMRSRAREAVAGALPGVSAASVDSLLDALQAASDAWCVCCGYKRKAATGEVGPPAQLEGVDSIRAVILNRQRDGDNGNLPKRQHQHVTVLWALREARAFGLTDEELANRTGVFRDTAKAARAGLMQGGWVEASEAKRLSRQGRPMTVWRLTPAAREELGGWGGQEGVGRLDVPA